jgi:hypothetical protein
VIVLFTDINYSAFVNKEMQIHDIEDNFNFNHNINNGVIIALLDKKMKKIIIENDKQNLQTLLTDTLDELKATIDTIKLLQTAMGGFINADILDTHIANIENKKNNIKELLEKK